METSALTVENAAFILCRAFRAFIARQRPGRNCIHCKDEENRSNLGDEFEDKRQTNSLHSDRGEVEFKDLNVWTDFGNETKNEDKRSDNPVPEESDVISRKTESEKEEIILSSTGGHSERNFENYSLNSSAHVLTSNKADDSTSDNKSNSEKFVNEPDNDENQDKLTSFENIEPNNVEESVSESSTNQVFTNHKKSRPEKEEQFNDIEKCSYINTTTFNNLNSTSRCLDGSEYFIPTDSSTHNKEQKIVRLSEKSTESLRTDTQEYVNHFHSESEEIVRLQTEEILENFYCEQPAELDNIEGKSAKSVESLRSDTSARKSYESGVLNEYLSTCVLLEQMKTNDAIDSIKGTISEDCEKKIKIIDNKETDFKNYTKPEYFSSLTQFSNENDLRFRLASGKQMEINHSSHSTVQSFDVVDEIRDEDEMASKNDQISSSVPQSVISETFRRSYTANLSQNSKKVAPRYPKVSRNIEKLSQPNIRYLTETFNKHRNVLQPNERKKRILNKIKRSKTMTTEYLQKIIRNHQKNEENELKIQKKRKIANAYQTKMLEKIYNEKYYSILSDKFADFIARKAIRNSSDENIKIYPLETMQLINFIQDYIRLSLRIANYLPPADNKTIRKISIILADLMEKHIFDSENISKTDYLNS